MAEPDTQDPTLEAQVRKAQQGNRAALEAVVRAVQGKVYGLALRFLWHPQDAEDAAQEILIRLVTHLGGFRGESSFRTWAYRVASNTLLNLRRQRMEEQALDFARFGADLDEGLSDAALAVPPGQEEALLLEEVRIGCTLAVLLCLERPQRMAYILGEILEFDHREGAAVLGLTPAAFRQRLARARDAISGFMLVKCGLVNPANPCRCRRRANTAVARGRVDPQHLLHASSLERARRFPEVLAEIRRLEETRRVAALYRSHPPGGAGFDFTAAIRDLLDGHA